jgi:hypothetical protein
MFQERTRVEEHEVAFLEAFPNLHPRLIRQTGDQAAFLYFVAGLHVANLLVPIQQHGLEG